jgi:hypothetical protein
MNTLERTGGEDVAFMQPDVADADDTVDNQEQEDPPMASPGVPAPDTTPPGEVSPNDPTDDIVVTGDGPDDEPDAPIQPVEQDPALDDDTEVVPPQHSEESYQSDPNDDGIDSE